MKMNTNRFFELFAMYGWPMMRHLVRLSRRCDRCILSEKRSHLVNGICAECRANRTTSRDEAPEVSEETRVRFSRTIQLFSGKSHYDALLLLSGGKDSAYILHRLKQDYPELKILCVTVNNGFMSPVAIANAEKAAQKLSRDHIIINSEAADFASVLRLAFLNLNGRGGYGIVDHADGSKIFDIGKQLARDLDIPLVIGGLSWIQVQRIVGGDDFEMKEPNEPRIIFPLAVWRTHEQKILEYVRLHDLMIPGSDSPIVSNSTLILAMSVIDVLNLGYSSFEPEFAQMVREGKTERKLWLHLFELLEYASTRGILKRDVTETLQRLDLRISDVVKEAA